MAKKHIVRDDSILTLWTIQNEGAYKKFEETGILTATEEYAFIPEDYDWMCAQMKMRGITPLDQNTKYPIWAWYKYDGKRKKVDLRTSGHAKHGTKMVLMEIEIPTKDVLLSDFDLWHYVLNKWFLSDYEVDADELLTSDQEKLEKSWQYIFDIDWAVQKYGIPADKQYVQATLWQVTREQVKYVQHFVTR